VNILCASANQAIEQDVFDLLLVDFDLDDGKGDVLIRELRPAHNSVPIIGVSSHEKGNTALVKAGATAICSKMDFDGIQKVIDEVVKSSH